jgi:signal transduction histidine kinase/CheY-like chemotaxis protein
VTLVVLAIVPAIGVEIHSARELRQNREQQIAQESSRLLNVVVAEQQRIHEGARQLLVSFSEGTAVRTGDWAACDRLASRIQSRVSGYVNLGIATSDGDLLCSALPIPENRDMRRRNFLEDMTSEGDLLVGRYHVGLITGEKVLTIALPVRSQGGGTQYVAWANLDLTWLAQHFSDRFATSNLTLLMADAAGTILVRLPDNDAWAGKPIGDAYMPMVTAVNSGVTDVTGIDGEERIIAYAPVVIEPKGLYIGVGLSKAPYLAEIAANTRQNIEFISLSFALALAAAWFGGGAFIREPVNRLLDVARRWQSGDYTARVGKLGGHSEIWHLSEAFDAMAAAVERRQNKQDEAEKALATLNAELGDRVKTEVRQREDAQRALAQSQKMDALGQLTSGVAHDFNNLLAAILGNLELLGLRVNDAKSRQLVENATGAANRGSKLIAQLLAFSRERRLELQPFDPNGLLSGMSELLDRTIGPTVTVAYSLGKDLWPATADASQIEVAVLNLAINARDAMPVGGALLVETANIAGGDKRLPRGLSGDFVMIAISDTGAGMTEEVKTRAFEPFYTTKEVGKGTGLGLSMVYGVAKQSGGATAIDSAIGKGTTVAIFLPRATEAPPPAVSPAQPKIMADRSSGGAKVMVVDDDRDVRAVTVTGLSEAGFEVIDFDNGQTAIAGFDEHRDVQLLVTDYAMPAMNGLELIQRLRERAPKLPAIVITGYANPIASLVVPDDLKVLRKPFRVTELIAFINTTIAKKSAASNVVPLARPLT